ncbi:hypothetical protein [Pseudoalteromonas sp. MMG012]|nr:hypothetical protein [Pseudoalteromonas sp. MMG012]
MNTQKLLDEMLEAALNVVEHNVEDLMKPFQKALLAEKDSL